MPNYDFKCNDCQKEFSVFCSVSKKVEQICPDCGSAKLESVFKSVNIGSSSGGSIPPSGFG